MSTLIVAAHVKEGIDLALKYKLAEPIIDAIREHHGTTLMSYFHARALRQHEDAKVGVQIMNLREEDLPEVEEETFRYSGPKPQSKETAILMIADSVEAASRSLEKPTPQQIESLVHTIVQDRVRDGQFEECPISLKELEIISQKFVFTLKTMLHSRIAYPKEDKAAKDDKAKVSSGEKDEKNRNSPSQSTKTAPPSPQPSPSA